MYRLKLGYAISVLIFSGLLFLGVLIYLNVAFFDLKKEKFQLETKSTLSRVFFSIPYNSEGLHFFIDTMLSQPGEISGRLDNQAERFELKKELQEIFINYQDIEAKITDVLDVPDYKPEFDWKVSITKFELRLPDTSIVVVDKFSDTPDELPLFGTLLEDEDAWDYLFYKIGDNFFCQVQLYMKFTNIFQLIRKQMQAVFFVDLILLLLFASIIGYTIRTLKRQLKLSEMQADFINSISHEFNTPLSTIQVAAQALGKLQAEQLEERKDELATTILSQKTHLQNMVEQILTISMGENKVLVLDNSVVGVGNYMQELIGQWRKSLNRQIELEILLADDRKLYLDPGLMKIALMNVLDNAVKYCNSDKPQITISGKVSGSFYRLDIEDNGIGIPVHAQKRIFKKFQRLKSDNGKRVKGLGLGLYLVAQIIKLHKGRISVQSEPGKGSVFTFDIPLANE